MKKDHFPLNMKKHIIAQEVPTPIQVEKMEEPKILFLIYKAIFYCLSVLCDIRWNTSHLKTMSKKKNKKFDNPVIKNTDKILVKGVVPFNKK